MKQKRGRPGIKPFIKQLIYANAIKDESTPRLALALELKRLIEEMGEVSPSEETMIKLISEARNQPDGPLDKVWSLGCLAEYEISPEALPAIMRVYRKYHREKEGYFTIRWAMWIARLYKFIEDPDMLEKEAHTYALQDWMNKGKTIDTRELDTWLMDTWTKFPECFTAEKNKESIEEKLKKQTEEAYHERTHNQAVQE